MKSLKYDSDLQKAVLKTSHGRRTQGVMIPFIDSMINPCFYYSFQTGAAAAAQKGGFFSKMKNVFSRQKNTDVPVASSNSTGRLGTASRAAQQQQLVQNNPPPVTAARRPTTASKRPTTAVQAAGFTGGKGAFGSSIFPSGPSQYEKKEER